MVLGGRRLKRSYASEPVNPQAERTRLAAEHAGISGEPKSVNPIGQAASGISTFTGNVTGVIAETVRKKNTPVESPIGIKVDDE